MLDARLGLAFRLYEPCALAADIGTDHAHLPVALLRSGVCERMILTDISPDALDNARAHIAKAFLSDRAELRLGAGLFPLREPCAMISILGMGGRTIHDILVSRPEALQGATLLLSAHTDLPLVRQAVMDIGYHLVSETPCQDAGRHYLILKAAPGPETLTAQELRLGKALFDSPPDALLPYLKHRLNVLEAKLSGLRRASVPDADQISAVQEDISILKGVIDP